MYNQKYKRIKVVLYLVLIEEEFNMSEFSENYHYKGKDVNAVVQLIKNAGLKGYVYPEKNGWISFVVNHDGMPPEQLIKQITNKVLFYAYYEDHGWIFRIYEKGQCVSDYSCGFDLYDDELTDFDEEENGSETLVVKRNQYNENILKSLLNDEKQLDEIEKILSIETFEDFFEKECAYRFAILLELPYYEWFSYRYLEYNDEYAEDGIYVE